MNSSLDKLPEHAVVDKRILRGDRAELVRRDGERFTLPRFSPVGKGDYLVEDRGALSVLLHRGTRLPLTPTWSWSHKLDLNPHVRIIVKEIETNAELEGYRRLTAFHYRGAGGAGRRVPLVAVADQWDLPGVVGFVELSSTFLVNTARAKVLDAPFSDPDRGTAWTGWTSKTANELGNSVVRISRCVVFPELRGLGVSKLLAQAATRYARERWHLGGLRPSFIEITAEMLRYWPFVSGAGFVFVGETEGNQHRAAKDMRYLLNRKMGVHGLPQGGGGIMSAQRAYATRLAAVMQERHLSIDQIVGFLHQSPDKLSDEDWVKLHGVFRRPKPTFMRGLTPASEGFLARRVPHSRPKTATPQQRLVLSVEQISITARATPSRSVSARRVQEAFGIVATEFESRLLESFSFDLQSGEILLVGGPSGSGKSLFLQSLHQMLASAEPRVVHLSSGVSASGTVKCSPRSVQILQDIPGDRSPIELLEDSPLDSALEALASAGLAEAQLFVRPSRTLSMGQRYRLKIAIALATRPDLILIDEFCESLDPYTTAAVCLRLRYAAAKYGLSIIAATANPRNVLPNLRPDRMIQLASDGHPVVIDDPTQIPLENVC